MVDYTFIDVQLGPQHFSTNAGNVGIEQLHAAHKLVWLSYLSISTHTHTHTHTQIQCPGFCILPDFVQQMFLQSHVILSSYVCSSFDEYVHEVTSGRLEWSPVHKSEKFWVRCTCVHTLQYIYSHACTKLYVTRFAKTRHNGAY